MTHHLTTHPLIRHKLTVMRNEKTSPSDYRNLLKEITFYLGYEATRDLNVTVEQIQTPLKMAVEGNKIAESVALIPILRAGLGMCDAMLELLPNASVHHIGMYRSEHSTLPVQYYNKLPKGANCDVAYILDVSINTSHTVGAVCSMVKKWGAKRIVIIAIIISRVGLERLQEQHPDVEIYLAGIDELLNESGQLVPGLGDAGDRQFGGRTHAQQDAGSSSHRNGEEAGHASASSSSSSSAPAPAPAPQKQSDVVDSASKPTRSASKRKIADA